MLTPDASNPDASNPDMPQWDDVVDVLCYGHGFGVLATAISAADADGTVLLVRPAAEAGNDRVLFSAIDDLQTREYLDELSVDVPEGGAATGLVLETVTEVAPADIGAPIEPFYGARLHDWAGQCLMSPYGVLYTRLPDQAMTAMKGPSGEVVQVRSVGTFTPERGADVEASVNDWLAAAARERALEVMDGAALQRIVFEDGEVVGAVLVTADGVRAVRVRHGIAMATGLSERHSEWVDRSFDTDQSLQVAVVGRSASRFGRIELLRTESEPPTEPPTPSVTSSYCRSRRVRDGLRDAGRSDVRRCRKMHRYPPLGE